jgi:hypothetical protein
LVRARLAVLRVEHEENKGADQRDQTDQDPPTAASGVVPSLHSEGKCLIQVTEDGQTFWFSEGDSQQADGDSRTGREGTRNEETVIISTEESYTPPPGEVATLAQQGQQFGETASPSIPAWKNRAKPRFYCVSDCMDTA